MNEWMGQEIYYILCTQCLLYRKSLQRMSPKNLSQLNTRSYSHFLNQLLDELIAKARIKSKTLAGAKRLGLLRAIHKWERLREEIEQHMMKPPHVLGSNNTNINPISRKRRADIALTSSELYQKQRCKVRLSSLSSLGGSGSGSGSGDVSEQLRLSVETGIVSMLKKACTGMRIDDTTLEQLLYNPYNKDPSRTPQQNQLLLGGLLAKHASSIEYLLRSLFVPKSRATKDETRLKCSKLVALAVMAEQQKLRADIFKVKHKDGDTNDTKSSSLSLSSSLSSPPTEEEFDYKLSEIAKVSRVSHYHFEYCTVGHTWSHI